MNWRVTSSQLQRASEPSGDRISETTPKAVLHLFSNGSNIKLRHLLHCFDARNMKLKTRAVILGSCPDRASLEGGSHFVTVGIKTSVARVIARNGVYAAYRMYMGVKAGFAAVGLPFKDMSKHPIEIAAPYAVSEKNPDGNVTGPRLFLYSDEDKLCQVHEIQERIEACKAEGVGSDHVRDAVVHKKEYRSLVAAFLGL
ncbi:hypothetical protein HDU78_007285 [Chytriomyces hyalinus]|nr:hypothetical protein HDU78_007285 [Chytriomyces hyalinus]